MSTTHDTQRARGRWLVFAICVAAALGYLSIGLARHEIGFAIAGPLIMLGYGTALLVFGSRSEIVGLLAGCGSDERRAALQLRAVAATGQVLILAVLAGALWALAAGSDLAGVFVGLCALGGVTYLGATAWYSRRG